MARRVATRLAPPVDVVTDRRAARPDRLPKRCADCGGEGLRVPGWQGERYRAWMDVGREERFIDVDVAEATEEALIKQCRLEAAPSALQAPVQRRCADGQGVRPQS